MATKTAVLHHKPQGRPFQRIYVWELPVRVFHWVNALGILILVITGYLIGNPLVFWSTDGEPSDLYWFGWTRFTHFAAGYVVFFAFLFRLYWGFIGNKYARWANFVPLKRSQFRDLHDTIRVDILQIRSKGKIAVGHNFLAALSYIGLFVIFIFMVITGFGLYASMSESWIPWLFAWIVPLMGSDQAVRRWHHIFMWAFVVFSIIHVYLCFYHDFVEGRGEISSMVGGWKFERPDKEIDE